MVIAVDDLGHADLASERLGQGDRAKAVTSRSSLVSLLRNTNRTGMNRAGLPRPWDGTRSTACKREVIVSVSMGKSTANCHLAVLKSVPSATLTPRSPS